MIPRGRLEEFIDDVINCGDDEVSPEALRSYKTLLKDLEILEILKNHLWQDGKKEVSWVNSRGRKYKKIVKTIEVIVFEVEEDYRKLKEWLKNEISI